jgi:hypothetical protein
MGAMTFKAWQAAMRSQGVILRPGRLPVYTAGMSREERERADFLLEGHPEHYERQMEKAP